MADAEKYEQHKEKMAERSRAKSAAGREIGDLPAVADRQRRDECRFDFRRFCDVYNPAAFSLGWSPYQLRAAKRIEECVLDGALYAFAEPRGGGKTTRCRMAVLWAASYAHRRFPVLIGANDEKAGDGLEALKTWIRFLPLFAADFPEISYPAARLKGIAQGAKGQTFGGNSTLIEWSAGRIVFPTLRPSADWLEQSWLPDWPLREDGMVPTSGVVVDAVGLTGEGIRGTLVTLSTGEQLRPDLVICDDPQTRESARSPTQNATREALLSADVLGMGGPDKTISALMPCTIIYAGDMADCMTDRQKHPLWRGERTKMLESMPTNMDAWRKYFEVYTACTAMEPPDLTAANEHYLANREVLDAGAAASWEDRKYPNEISAVQHAMHRYFRDPKGFASEYQSAPESDLDPAGAATQIEEAALARKLNTVPRAIVPRDCNMLTSFIDVQQEVLFYMVCGWTDGFGGSIVDYGAFPPQNRAMFEASSPSPALSTIFPQMKPSARIYAGLAELVPMLLARHWDQVDGGGKLVVAQLLIDAGHETETIHDFISRSPLKAIIKPSMGRGIDPTAKPMNEYRKEAGDETGWNWRIDARPQGKGRFVSFDTYPFKDFVADGLLAPPGTSGAIYLPGGSIAEHPLLVTHLTSEFRTPSFAASGWARWVNKWKVRPDRRENHLFDTLVGCALAASVAGRKFNTAAAAGDHTEAASEQRRKATREDFERKRREFEAKRGF